MSGLKDVKFTFNGLSKWVGFLGGIIAVFLAVLQTCAALKMPKHELSIQIPKLEIFDSTLRLSVVFHNIGDFNEIVTSIGLYLVEDLGVQGKENNTEIAEFNKMILVDSRKTVGEILEGLVDFNVSRFDILLDSGKTYAIVTRFVLVSENGDSVTESIPIGALHLVRNIKNGEYQGDLGLTSMRKWVDFSKSERVLTITNLPRKTEFDLPNLEIVK